MCAVRLMLLLAFAFTGCASNPRALAQRPPTVAPTQNPSPAASAPSTSSAESVQNHALTPAISAQLQSCIARQRNLEEQRERISGMRDRVSFAILESGYKRDCSSLMKQYGPGTAPSTAAAPSAIKATPGQVCERVGKWLGQGRYTERAGFTPNRSAYEHLRTAQLLQDEFFSTAFGQPYDRFSIVEIEALGRQVLACDGSVSMGNDKGNVLQIFSIDANARNVATVIASRPAAAELDGLIQTLDGVQSADDPAGMLRDIEAVARPLAQAAPGANAISFYEKVAAIQADMKSKALDLQAIAERKKLEKQIEVAATPADLSNLKMAENDLSQKWPKFSKSDVSQWGGTRDKLQAKIHALATTLAAEELASYRALEKSGNSLEALRALSKRNEEIAERYGFNRDGYVLGMPEFASLNREQSEHRVAVLARYSSNIVKTDGMKYAEALRSVSVGEFDKVDLKNGRGQAMVLVSGYLEAFSSNCSSSLPADSVEITSKECKHEVWKVDNRGIEVIGSRYCAEYQPVRTGKYADPKVADVYIYLGSSVKADTFIDFFAARKNPNDFLASKIELYQTVAQDMRRLLDLNGCASDVTKRFQRNLIQFGWERKALAIYEPLLSKPVIKEAIVPLRAPMGGAYGATAAFGATWCEAGCKGNNEPVEEMLITPEYPLGPPVRVCDYEMPMNEGGKYFFWANTPPTNIKALLAADPRGILRYLGTKATKICPATIEEALKLRQAAMVETGFPPR